MQDITKASRTTLGRVPVVEPHSPCSLTFKAPNSVTDVAETAVVDHGSHNVDMPIKACPKSGSAEGGRTRRKRPTLANPVLAIMIWPIWANPILANPFWAILVLARANFGQNQFWPIQFWIWCVSWWGPERWGPEGGGGRGAKFRAFFPSPAAKFVIFSLSGCLLVEFWWCLKRRGGQMCTLGVLGLSCETRAAPRSRPKH